MTSGAPPAVPAGGPAYRNGSAPLVWAAVGLVAALVIAWGVYGLIREKADPGDAAPPVLGQVPDFSLTERSGENVTLASLRGQTWIVDFIFTRCQGVCPLLSVRMRDIQTAIADRSGVKLVSISVDPQYDSTEVLDAYARDHGADPARWLFLTGPWEATRKLIGQGFRLSVAQSNPGEVPVGELVTHSDRFVLVDPLGRIRGYYHGTDDEGIEKLLSDLDHVTKEP